MEVRPCALHSKKRGTQPWLWRGNTVALCLNLSFWQSFYPLCIAKWIKDTLRSSKNALCIPLSSCSTGFVGDVTHHWISNVWKAVWKRNIRSSDSQILSPGSAENKGVDFQNGWKGSNYRMILFLLLEKAEEFLLKFCNLTNTHTHIFMDSILTIMLYGTKYALNMSFHTFT